MGTFKRLEQSNWFDRVGLPYIDDGLITGDAEVLSSWEEAIAHCSSSEWGVVLNESANILRVTLARQHTAEFKGWNERVMAIKSISVPLVKMKITEVQSENNLPSIFETIMHALVSMVLLEAEYSNLVEPGNFSKLAFWIVNGHFPCGWRGEFPNGNLVIY